MDTSLEIKTLETEYDVILRQYEEAYQNYVQYTESNNHTYSKLTGRSFWGKTGISEKSDVSESECEDMCLTNDSCTGATYNSNKRYCWTRSGESALSVGLDADVAIIPTSRELLLKLKHYNRKLLEMNKKMADYYSNIPLSEMDTELNEKHAKLIEYNAQLQSERDTLDIAESELETIVVQKENHDLVATRGQTQFRFWLLIASILLIVSLKMMLISSDDSSVSSSSSVAGFAITVLVLLGASFMLRTVQGFMIFGLIVFALIVIKLLSNE